MTGRVASEVAVPLHGAVLDSSGPWRRRAPRAVADRQAGYDARFDELTLFYDVFRRDGAVEIIGPPLLNLDEGLRPMDLRASGRRYARAFSSHAKDRLHRHRIDGIPAEVRTMRLRCPLGTFRLEIGEDLSPAFADRRVLVTQSRNNPLPWIADWVDHHVRTQGIDAVVLYDNASTSYRAEEIREMLRARPGLEAFSVVEWPYPWGPTGGPQAVWDSDFGQHGSWEHALRRLCRSARTITFGDIDELIVGPLPTVTDRALAAPEGICSYRRRSVLALPQPGLPSDRDRRYADYLEYDPAESLLSPKYTVAPTALAPHHQLMVHRVDPVEVSDEQDILVRHFDGMRIEWREGDESPVGELSRKNLAQITTTTDDELRRVISGARHDEQDPDTKGKS